MNSTSPYQSSIYIVKLKLKLDSFTDASLACWDSKEFFRDMLRPDHNI